MKRAPKNLLGLVMQTQRKGLSYHIVEDRKVLSINREMEPQVQVRFRGRRVSAIRRVTVRFINVGNTQIVPSDYSEPLTLCFDKDAMMFQAEVSGSDPEDLQAVLQVDTHHPNQVHLNSIPLHEGSTSR